MFAVSALFSCKKSSDDTVALTISDESVILAVGEEKQISIVGIPADQVSWSSLNPLVADVNNAGVITAYKTGTVDIKGTYKNATAVSKINVVIGNYQKSWAYDFGTVSGNLSPTSAAGILSANDNIPSHLHPLLPAPGNAQIARAWTGSSNVGGFTLATDASIGSGASLLFKAPSSTSTSKFSILNIDGTNLFSISYRMKLQAGNAGTYKFAIGRDLSTMDWLTASASLNATQFSNNLNFSPTAALPTFLIMWWNITATGYQLNIQQKDKTLLAIDAGLNPNVSFVNGGDYHVQAYLNNSTSSKKYLRDQQVYTILAGASHIWINNSLLLKSEGNANFVTSELDANTALNAFMFMGLSNTNNNSLVYLDDFKYANYISDIR